MLLLTSVKDSGGKSKQGLTDNLGDAAEVSQHKVYNIYTNKQLNGAIRWGENRQTGVFRVEENKRMLIMP